VEVYDRLIHQHSITRRGMGSIFTAVPIDDFGTDMHAIAWRGELQAAGNRWDDPAPVEYYH